MIVICTFLAMLQLALEGYLQIQIESGDMSKFSLIKSINEHLN
jgi:hypothetical protein